MEYTAHTAIIGAGITGLCTAYALQAKNHSSHVFDRSDVVGGAIQSNIYNGYLAESGPNSLLVKDTRVAKLINEIGLSEGGPLGHERLLATKEAHKRYIVQGGKTHAMPSSPSGILKTPLFSLKGKLRILCEPLIGSYKGDGEESFAHFVTRRFGKELLESAAAPFVSGIYAGNPDQLSIRHAFPRMYELVEQHGSVLKGAIAMQSGKAQAPYKHKPTQTLSFKSGMQVMPRAIAEQLSEGSLKLATELSNIKKIDDGWQLTWTDSAGITHQGFYKKLVISVPHHKLKKLPLEPEILAKLSPLKAIKAPPVTSLVLGFRRANIEHPLDGFGMLIKKAEQSPLLGVLFSSSMFEHRAPQDHVTLTCMMGGALNPQYAQNTEEVVIAELDRLLGLSVKPSGSMAKPTFSHRTEWPQAIPQYDLSYQNIIDAITSCQQAFTNLHIAANYYQGISVSDCIINGLELGEHLATDQS